MPERRQTVAEGTRGASPRYRLISEIRSQQSVRVSPAARIDLVRYFENPIAVTIEGVQDFGFVSLGVRIHLAKCPLIHKEANFERSVVTPESHAAPASIVTPAVIWETECHAK
jgi:hypothetical protein